MQADEKVNILLVDDQPGKLLSYQVILEELGENLLTAASAKEALQILLKTDVAVLLVDVCMPELDGFEFAAMVREHPRFKHTAIIFISAVHLSDVDSERGYSTGAVDYLSVPIVPALLRAKVRVFVDLYRKTKTMERWNAELEARVAARTAELEQANKRQELLAREVDHRAKNALAVVQSIIRLTKAEDIRTFADTVHGRIRALATAHTLLSASRWTGASLAKLVEDELTPYRTGPGRARAMGPDVTLRPDAAQAVAMVIHELATNAAKYGALSAEAGRITLAWTLEDGCVHMTWREEGGPPVAEPSHAGFGTRVINATIKDQLGGDVAFEWSERGLQCSISFMERTGDAPPARRRQGERSRPGRSGLLQGMRIMIVEDEPLIAMMLSAVIEEHGGFVVGPFGKVEDAASCPTPVDAAVLDLNLGGVSTLPLAHELKRRGCPLAIATGYDESIAGLADAPILRKPIDPELLAGTLADLLFAREPAD